MSSSPPTSAHATARTPGIDVARAVAVLGMVLVNYRTRMEALESGPEWLAWVIDRIEGRAAALFVVLAGLGVSLRSRRAREEPARYLRWERRALLTRAVVLGLLGLLHMHFWEWDILHFYGVYLAVAAFLLASSDAFLLLLAVFCVVGATLLQSRLSYDNLVPFWTLRGCFRDVVFNGLHPTFPWMAFLLVGMWLGRRDLDQARIRRHLLWGGLLLTVLAEGADTLAFHVPDWFGLTEQGTYWLSSGPRPARPTFVLASVGVNVALIAACVSVTAPRPRAGWVVYLTATGQMAFTLYVAHTVAIVIPQYHELLVTASLITALGYAAVFYLLGVAGSVWWRSRFPHGPIEGLIRQVTGRTNAAPWGGVRLSELPPAPTQPPARPRARSVSP